METLEEGVSVINPDRLGALESAPTEELLLKREASYLLDRSDEREGKVDVLGRLFGAVDG